MGLKLVICLLFISLKSMSQCDDLIGYDKNGSLTLSKPLKGHLSMIDTSMKVGIIATLAKTAMTNGITIMAIFPKEIGTIDGSTKVRFIYQDGSSIILDQYAGNSQSNNAGIFFSVVVDKYKLLILRSKPVSKVEVTGALLNAATYLTDTSTIDFMLGLECLQSYL